MRSFSMKLPPNSNGMATRCKPNSLFSIYLFFFLKEFIYIFYYFILFRNILKYEQGVLIGPTNLGFELWLRLHFF